MWFNAVANGFVWSNGFVFRSQPNLKYFYIDNSTAVYVDHGDDQRSWKEKLQDEPMLPNDPYAFQCLFGNRLIRNNSAHEAVPMEKEPGGSEKWNDDFIRYVKVDNFFHKIKIIVQYNTSLILQNISEMHYLSSMKYSIIENKRKARVTTGTSATHQSINQSIDRSNRRLRVIQSINQSIIYFWSLLIALIKQSSNESTYRSCHIWSVPNQSINWLPFRLNRAWGLGF